MQFLVFPRKSYPNAPLYEGMKVIDHENLVVSDISSTDIREKVKNGLPIDTLVPPKIAGYIADHKLYI